MNEEEMDYIADRIASRLISFMETTPNLVLKAQKMKSKDC